MLPHAVRVLDVFHVVRLGFAAVDEVRRRIQQETTGHRGRKDDPLYRTLRGQPGLTGVEVLEAGADRIVAGAGVHLEQPYPVPVGAQRAGQCPVAAGQRDTVAPLAGLVGLVRAEVDQQQRVFLALLRVGPRGGAGAAAGAPPVTETARAAQSSLGTDRLPRVDCGA